MYVAACLDPLRLKFFSFHSVFYMNDILLAATTKEESLLMFAELQTLLVGRGFILAPEKVQMQPPIPIWAFKSNPLGFSLRGCSWIALICRPSMTGRNYWEMFSGSVPPFPFLRELLSPCMTCYLGTLPLPPPES